MNYKQLILIVFIIINAYSHILQFQAFQPHNRNCYTQGLFFYNQTHLFQSCGWYNKSYFHLIQFKANPFKLSQAYSTFIPWKNNIFLEGAVLFGNYIYVLTWREHIVYKLDASTFDVVQQIIWPKQGWGLTSNQTHMFVTDGSHNIYVVDQNFKLVDQKAIYSTVGRRIFYINELEFVNGYIYANIYLNTKIVKIDYQNAKVVQQYDANKIINAEKKSGKLNNDQVINGIAYDIKSDSFLITGKNWGNVYQVRL